MGAVTAALDGAARRAGATVLTRAYVNRLDTDGEVGEVAFRDPDGDHVVECAWVLGGVAPWVLRLLLGVEAGPRPEGAQVKINMLLDRLPRLRSGAPATQALAGTFHVGEGYDALQDSFLQAARGELPEVTPGELYCHSLTDPSILGPQAARGQHTLTWFGLHTPARLFLDQPVKQLDEVVLRVLDSINVHLAEPIESLLALDRNGDPCLQASSPQNVESALAMPGGHIFHGALAWPWSLDPEYLETPAERWGVETAWPNVLRCGAGAARGGAVSGIGGHNAAMAVLETVRAAPGLAPGPMAG
jgi:phytoene dehydrogenase-like protein